MTAVRLNLPFPPSVNAMYANGGNKRGRHKTPSYKSWEQEATLYVKDSMRLELVSYSLMILLEAPDKRRRDLGNYEKAVSDFLVSQRIVKDDCYSKRIVLEWGYNLPSPCVVMVQSDE